MTLADARISLAGSSIDLREFDEAIDFITRRAMTPDTPPLAVASINLDHIHHFGAGSAWSGVLDAREHAQLEWLKLIDGAPLAAQAKRMTGHAWPRLAGSDLIAPTLAAAERNGTSVGFLGGAESTHDLLRAQLTEAYPALQVTGFWAPTREDLSDTERSQRLAREIARARTDILVVGLGKPRQELWISRYGSQTGARVLLAFGAVVDFLAGRVSRAPRFFVDHGLEWAWRLALEPKRLATRYLIEDPPAYLAVRRTRWRSERDAPVRAETLLSPVASPDGRFLPAGEHADVSVIAYAPRAHSRPDLMSTASAVSLECGTARVRFIAATGPDFGPALDAAATGPVTCVMKTAGDAPPLAPALRFIGDADTVLLMPAGVRPAPGTVRAMLARMARQGAGVVVPRVVGADGLTRTTHVRTPSLRRTLMRALGSGAPAGPDTRPESYENPHRVDADTSGILLIHRDVFDTLGVPRSIEEPAALLEYFARVRAAGIDAWYEPDATLHEPRSDDSRTTLTDAATDAAA
ncbi:WecB/TagA/CpsF family glycosyltransferase [Rathayibacter sp. YIM 133350]|uniref:WecB/TagA/CpsF family glycosyltransferase n=1 Tax=Rathayibacter sp. YIM 133350 TaxID=3131992 RepID=UPI00307E0EAD